MPRLAHAPPVIPLSSSSSPVIRGRRLGIFLVMPSRALAAHHAIRNLSRTISYRQRALFAHWTERAVFAEEVVNAFRMENVPAGKFPDHSFQRLVVVKTNRAGRLRLRLVHLRLNSQPCRWVVDNRNVKNLVIAFIVFS